MSRWTPLFLSSLWLTACTPLPEPAVQSALYVDLRKSVELNEDVGWIVDRSALDDNTADAMRSVCQVDAEHRANLESWLNGQIALNGGPAELTYRNNGGDLGEAAEALTLERVRMLLRHANEHAARDCPFWLEQDAEFPGVQGDTGRVVLLLESMGFGAVVIEDGKQDLGGGGGGRVLIGHGVGPRMTLAFGAEVGGSGAFVANDRGSRDLKTTFTGAAPLMVRWTDVSRVFDIELAPVVRFNPDLDLLPPGIRAAAGVGFATMRSSSWMPYVVLWLGYEYHPNHGTDREDHNIRAGTRVGVDWDL